MDPFEEDVPIDGFVVMNSGMKTIKRIQRSPCPGNDQLLERMRLYKYHPPELYSISSLCTKSRGRLRLIRQSYTPKKPFHPLYHVNEFGGIEGEEFHMSGVPVIIDDVVSSGRTLELAAQYVHSLGYPYEDVFVYAQQHFPPVSENDGFGRMLGYSVSRLSRYSDLLEDILLEELSCTTSP